MSIIANTYSQFVIRNCEFVIDWKQAEQAITACCAAAAGTTTPRIAALRIGTTTIPTTGTTMSASAWFLSLSSKPLPDSRVSEPACFQALYYSRQNSSRTVTA